MIRLLVFLAALTAVAFGLSWIADRPGEIVLTWQGYRVETSLLVGLATVAALAFLVSVVFAILRFVFKIPSLMALAARARRRNRGLAALSRGMVAAGSGDARQARRAADEASRHLPGEPLALLLQAQAAQLSGDRRGTQAAFTTMLAKPETRLLGLRGLHVEARRRGDDEAAHDFAAQAHRIAPVPWAGQAVLEHHTAGADWEAALGTVEANLAARAIDRKTAGRQRALLQTAIAQDKAQAEPDLALQLAREALKVAPSLVPAAALAGRILARKGDIRRASKVLAAAWTLAPHPDLARIYLDVRPGDSTSDRMARARTLARICPNHIESHIMLAQAALDMRDFAGAHENMRKLIDGDARPTARMCLLMAQIEETEHGGTGRVREWLARASRAPRDATWIADGVMSDTWAPVSPVTGQLDAFEWRVPAQQLSAPIVAWEPAEATLPPLLMVQEAMPVVNSAPLPMADRQELPAAAISAPLPVPSLARPLAMARMAAPVIFPHPAAPDDPGLRGADISDGGEPEAVSTSAKLRFGFVPRD